MADKDDSYSDLIGESIDTLNAGGNFAGTKLKREDEKKPKHASESINLLPVALGILTLLSCGWYFYEYLEEGATKSVTREVADKELAVAVDSIASKEKRELVQPLEKAFRESNEANVAALIKTIKGLDVPTSIQGSAESLGSASE